MGWCVVSPGHCNSLGQTSYCRTRIHGPVSLPLTSVGVPNVWGGQGRRRMKAMVVAFAAGAQVMWFWTQNCPVKDAFNIFEKNKSSSLKSIFKVLVKLANETPFVTLGLRLKSDLTWVWETRVQFPTLQYNMRLRVSSQTVKWACERAPCRAVLGQLH